MSLYLFIFLSCCNDMLVEFDIPVCLLCAIRRYKRCLAKRARWSVKSVHPRCCSIAVLCHDNAGLSFTGWLHGGAEHQYHLISPAFSPSLARHGRAAVLTGCGAFCLETLPFLSFRQLQNAILSYFSSSLLCGIKMR